MEIKQHSTYEMPIPNDNKKAGVTLIIAPNISEAVLSLTAGVDRWEEIKPLTLSS